MLHIFYRACSIENNKPRPAFYSKAVCLQSCIIALKRVQPARLVVVHDGPVSDEFLTLLDSHGEIVELAGVGEAQSFNFTLELAAKCDPGDLVYLAEDDYIHAPEAFQKLCECFEQLPCDYVTLFDDPLRYHLSEDVPPDEPLHHDALYVSSSHHWRTIESTTLTFGGRVDRIAEDRALFAPHVLRRAADKRYIADRESWRELQGLGTYASTGYRRALLGAIPSLATHCEVTALSPTVDWTQLVTEQIAPSLRGRTGAHGGQPTKRTPPLPMMPGALELGEREERVAVDVIRSQRLNREASPWPTPSYVERLEHAFAEYVGAKYCLAVSSGTAALHCALVGLGIGPGDEVIVPAYTWMSSATTICLVGAVPVIVDIDASLTLDPAAVERCITPRTRAIMAVHMRGAPARMDAIGEIATRHGLLIVEDAAQAIGGSFHGRMLGTLGRAGCFSLQTYKIITTGEGGLLVTNDGDVYQRARSFHGAHPHLLEPRYHTIFTNYQMAELAGAVGCIQLERLDGLLQRMRRHKAHICDVLGELAQVVPVQLRDDVDVAGDTGVSATLFAETPAQADSISDGLMAENIGNFRLYRPGDPDYHLYKHWTPIMSDGHDTDDMCPRSIDLLGRAVDINIYPQLTENELMATIAGLRKVLSSIG